MNKSEFLESKSWVNLAEDVEKSIIENYKKGYTVASLIRSPIVEGIEDLTDKDILYTCMITYIKTNIFKRLT